MTSTYTTNKGFDKPAIQGGGPACASASKSSYGHTGFTGTYAWVDPETDLVFIFLSNRICPDPENKVKNPDPENHGLIPGEPEVAIRESMENGAAGICLFTPGRMTPED